ncbi:hypothetical protein ACF3DV_13975 [Chlorogloeopsis fritschii PCC 9212]|uniref:Uncharacterized protein n=1 Tax=Chlorogloeopsis fritschii PCC 6912 TaxID=211165 RepID=A0A433NRE2_CHLFR|nr:hypothetical protein [Chlorogloeopsis fritschii]RUR86729.1 hypothetical protein PCC6912_01720 [Chlorogloeopsis fritschii PCC 6912]
MLKQQIPYLCVIFLGVCAIALFIVAKIKAAIDGLKAYDLFNIVVDLTSYVWLCVVEHN